MALMFRSVLQNDGGAAELIVTCDSEFAGATISCSDGTTTLNKTCPSSSPYEVTFKIPNSGDWTISATVSGTAYTSDPISVELDYTALLEYGFNWRRWVDTAQYLDSTDYSTLSDLLADEEALRELCLEHACVDYLADIATANEDVETIINNDLFAKWVNNSDYSLDVLGANVAIKALMDTADKYGYGEWSLMPQVPTMTSNTAPYGEVIFSDIYGSGYEAYKAFDGVATTRWNGQNSVSNNYIGYHFTSPICIKSVYIDAYGTGNSKIALGGYKIQGSNDNFVSDIHDLYTGNTTGVTWQEHIPITVNLDNSASYEYYRLYSLGNPIDTALDSVSIWTIQFYAWQPKGNVPVMTSNTAPYGVASASSALGSGYNAFDAFKQEGATAWLPASGTGFGSSWCEYKAVNPICPKRVAIRCLGANYTYNFKLQGSNDGSSYTDLATDLSAVCDNSWKYFDVETSNYYLYLRMVFVSSTNPDPTAGSGYMFQFYGRELSVSVPTMTGNTTPYGEAFATSNSTGHDAYLLFDNDNSTRWESDGLSVTSNICAGYSFINPVLLKRVRIVTYSDNNSYPSFNIKIQASNDGFMNDIVDITDSITVTNGLNNRVVDLSVENTNLYKSYRVNFLTPTGTYAGLYYFNLCGLQFFGEDYSEKEFEAGTTKKWLYDHGVELDTLYIVGTKYDDCVQLTAASQLVQKIGIDTTNNNLARAKVGSHGSGTASLYCDDSYSQFNASNMPNTNGLDISSMNGEHNIAVAMGTNGAFDVAELWLE